MKTLHFSILLSFVYILSILIMSPVYAQNDSTFKYDPTLQYGSKTQTPVETPEQLHKKLVNARDAISNIMGSKMGNIPFNEVGIDEINSTLEVGIDSEKATLSEEQYLQKIKAIVGDIPIKITFSHITSLPLILANNSVRGNNTAASMPSPLDQFKSGIPISNVQCAQDLLLVIKAEDGTPACIKQDHIPKLILRGWISTTSSLDKNNVIFGDFYQGIENNSGIVSIKNQTYYMMIAANATYPVTSDMTVKFHQVTFSFPYGSQATPGGAITPFDMTFPDGTTETYGKVTKNPDGSGSISGIGLGPGPLSNRTVTVQSDHMYPQAGVTMTENQIKLLVSTVVNSSNSQIPEHIIPASFEPCDTPYSQSNTGIPVLYMPANSVGKVCVRYSNPNDTPARIFGIRFFDPNNSNQNAIGITTWNDIGNNYTIPKGGSTVVYWIKTGNQTGLYGLTIFCSGIPFAVGYYDKSNFTLNDFSWEKSQTINCPMMTYQYHIDSLSGIGIKYIPYP